MAADPSEGDLGTIAMSECHPHEHAPNVEDSLVDPFNSPREYHFHPHTRHQREIWRPGDADGDQRTDWFERPGPPLPKEQRWRLFQSDIGDIGVRKAIPPKYVFLDDRAAFEVINSDLPRNKICQWWPHDFGQPCKIRAKRAHVGRPAFKDERAQGSARYHTTQLGGKAGAYLFTGEPTFKPIVYRIPPAAPSQGELARKRKAESPEEYNPRGHGHNQFTPRDMMVKHGAPSMAKKLEKDHNLPPLPRPNAPFLRGTNDPIHVERRLYGGIAQSAHESVRNEALKNAARNQNMPQFTFAHEKQLDLSSADIGTGQERNSSSVGQQGIATNEAAQQTSRPPSLDKPLPPLPTAPIEIPRTMGWVERRDVENRIATQILQGIQTEAHVKQLGDDMAREKVKVGQQGKEIERLKRQLAASNSKNEDLAQEIENQSVLIGHLENKIGESTTKVEQLRGALTSEKRKKVQLELRVDSLNEEMKQLRQDVRRT